ncbi:hypothetical protein [Mesorhizobium sp. B1-1-7]|uniref:hypothetical protein n=1 Tax=Mesorhizobium sp. B1-1-7 TaxID=2589977 RepID=UPI001FEDE331|nr:hypothetical protein [Mesorhizobium sp. B1-1-7]
MTAVSTNEEPATTNAQAEKKWRRLSLAALAILLPLTLAETSYDSVRAWLRGEDLVARDVDFGQSVPFGGSDWRLADLRGGKAGRLPDHAFAVIATFSVTIGDTDLQKQWLGCKLMLTDAAGAPLAARLHLGRQPAGRRHELHLGDLLRRQEGRRHHYRRHLHRARGCHQDHPPRRRTRQRAAVVPAFSATAEVATFSPSLYGEKCPAGQ